jgi:hypothetical protein
MVPTLGIYDAEAWELLCGGNSFSILDTPNEETSLALGHEPTLTIDVREYACLDVQNRRGNHVSAFPNRLVNWGFVALDGITSPWSAEMLSSDIPARFFRRTVPGCTDYRRR